MKTFFGSMYEISSYMKTFFGSMYEISSCYDRGFLIDEIMLYLIMYELFHDPYWRKCGSNWTSAEVMISHRVRSNEKSTKKVDPFQNWFFVISDHYWTGLGWFKPFFAFRGPIGAVGGQFWVLGVLKGRKFEISKLDHFWPWDAIFLT